MCWYVPEGMWEKTEPEEEDRREALLAQMHLKRSRISRKSVLTKS
jgi:hypothetical protein